MHQYIDTNSLLLLDGVCHVLVDLILIVSIAQLLLLVGQAGTPDGRGLREGADGRCIQSNGHRSNDNRTGTQPAE